MYIDYSRRSGGRRKGLDLTPPGFSPASVTPSRRGDPLTPAERAHRIHALRTAPAGTAPLSQARVRRGEEGDRP
ncbi:MAG: hypothetical protein JO252_29020 [Planctomycetaceae bacterium]|nr:hypothetical protein [Planctomycetaceae bacterium]